MQATWSPIVVRTVTQGLATTQSLGSAVAIGAEALERFTMARVRGNAHVHMIPGAASATMLVGLGPE